MYQESIYYSQYKYSRIRYNTWERTFMVKMISESLKEQGMFEPPEDFVKQANMNDPDIYQRAEEDYEGFWEELADKVEWYDRWNTVLEWKPPYAKWFVGGSLNASYNCLDRHIDKRGDKTAILWEGEMGEVHTYTYRELLDATARFANALKGLGVKKGDIISIYLPMIPEAVIAMLACARIGAPHSVVFSAFSADSLAQRIDHKGKTDEGLEKGESIEKVVVVKHAGNDVSMQAGRDVWWHDIVGSADPSCEPEVMDSEDMLFLMYTSGTTGKPKGVVHTTGGYMVGTTVTANWVFDLKEDDIYWCTADVGWITGHSYIVYGPLSNGATVVMYEGAPDYPDKDKIWEIVEKHKVTIFYTAPTAVRMFMKWGSQWPEMHDLSTIRLIGSVGEPINPRAWLWYYETIGNSRCPLVDTWWQTETGMALLTPLPGIISLKPGSVTRPFPGIKAAILDNAGNEVPRGEDGFLALLAPWPSMIRTVYKNEQRYLDTYWSKWGTGKYLSGDGARQDEDGYFWILGRVDDVIKVAGHRLGTMELESALVSHPSVAEAAVVGKFDEIKGEVIFCYVTPKSGAVESKELRNELSEYVVKMIGPIARPDGIVFADELPKTRSGKIMRRILKSIVDGKEVGDVTTLQNPEVVEVLERKVKGLSKLKS
jgi:acetyl-CoA synthetase